MNWNERQDKILAQIEKEKKVFFNPRKQALNWQAALALVGRGLITYDGAYFYAKAKSNPRPRTGTKKPTRASTATGKAPTKRLVKRRKANMKAGYFPNPRKKTVRAPKPFDVQESNDKAHWTTVASCKTQEKAFQIAKGLSGPKTWVRVVKA